MGYFSNLAIEVESALFEGATVEQIAERFNLSVPAVEAYISQLEDADCDPYGYDEVE
jgi:DNA-binding NarL/FixJ family response regulator